MTNHPAKSNREPGVYYVFSDTDQTVLVAIDLRKNHNRLVWFDTVRERSMTIEQVLMQTREQFSFRRTEEEGGGVYTFVPITLELYREHIHPHLIAGREFKNLEELREALIETKKAAW